MRTQSSLRINTEQAPMIENKDSINACALFSFIILFCVCIGILGGIVSALESCVFSVCSVYEWISGIASGVVFLIIVALLLYYFYIGFNGSSLLERIQKTAANPAAYERLSVGFVVLGAWTIFQCLLLFLFIVQYMLWFTIGFVYFFTACVCSMISICVCGISSAVGLRLIWKITHKKSER